MGTYVVTGSASGMGKASADKLRAEGHTVIGIDLREADVVADLSSAAGRADAAAAVIAASGGKLDGAVFAAGLGPVPGRENLIAQVNFKGTTELLGALHDALAAAGNSKVVVIGSNSSTTIPGIPDAIVNAFLDDKLDTLPDLLAPFGEHASSFAYGGSKLALTRWVRRTAVQPEWAGSGIRLNVMAPGAILTPLLQSQLDGPGRAAIEAFPVPIGGFGDPEAIAAWIMFMLSSAADFLCGSIIVVDGGTEALFRADDWPVSMAPRSR